MWKWCLKSFSEFSVFVHNFLAFFSASMWKKKEGTAGPSCSCYYWVSSWPHTDLANSSSGKKLLSTVINFVQVATLELNPQEYNNTARNKIGITVHLQWRHIPSLTCALLLQTAFVPLYTVSTACYMQLVQLKGYRHHFFIVSLTWYWHYKQYFKWTKLSTKLILVFDFPLIAMDESTCHAGRSLWTGSQVGYRVKRKISDPGERSAVWTRLQSSPYTPLGSLFTS